ncbi:aminotransferase class I/II-fold pyridoxal phosphate-dependent enzyme [Streptomyces sp. NPDC005301]|uniref:aminotransferase class I/II-fold pyridoxal phosphate-dependent enzyme n=2 Tax=unclassified Streptomyces TaxID=2593676 RepID=UPI0033BD87B0
MAGYAALVLIVTGVYLSVPVLRTPLWAVIGLGGSAAVVTGVLVHRPAHRWPWLLLATGLLAFATGDTYYNVLEAYFDASNPFPSPADACYLATYPLFAAGLFGLVRYRWAGRDLPSLLDALILTAGLALPVWVLLVQPLTHVTGITWQQRAISIAYPLGDVLVLALLACLLAPRPAWERNRAVRLLVAGTATLLIFDIAYGILQLKGMWQAGTLVDTGWIVFYTAWGLAALHPSMAELTASVPQRESLLPRPRRLLSLALATLVAPGILLYEGLAGHPEDAAAIAAFSGVLFLLVILRLAGMVVAHREAVARELALRTAAASLMEATRPQEVTAACDRAVSTLFGPGVAHGTLLLPAERAVGLATNRTHLVPTGRLGPEIAAALGDLPTTLVCPMVPPDRPAGELPGALLAAGPEHKLAEIRGSLQILASHAALTLERTALRREIIRTESEAYFRTLVRNASDVILIVEDDDTVRYASPSARAVFGGAPLTGAALPELVGSRDRRRVTEGLTAMRRGGSPETHDHWWVLRDGDRIEVEVRCSDLREDPTVRGLVITLRDVTEQRRLEHELTERAFHDPLTGLPNRTLLLERIERALLRGRRESTLTCLLFVDLDDFKMVNDTMGHATGDRLLTDVGERLSGALRRSDTAARLGGDEFAVLMEDARQPLDAELLAAQVIQTLGRPFSLPGGPLSVSASVGVATARDSTDAEELLTHADLALYAAKGAGKRQWRRFQPRLRVRMVERHDIRARLDRAIDDAEFALRYQPVVGIEAGEVVGFEALARWPRGRGAPVPPEHFIALAEETGHIAPLGAWVLENAAADMAGLQRLAGETERPPYVSVNVSARQLGDNGFLDVVRGALRDLAPGTLQLELTETVLMRQDAQMQAMLRSLKDMGVQIAVDDFGTGFSSLRYLREFPVDALKIDKTFIDDIAVDPRQVALVQGIVNLAGTLGLDVVAEGIEDSAQRDLLAGMGCGFGQGYLFARPMTLEQSEFLLRRRDGKRTPASVYGPAANGNRDGRATAATPAPPGGRPLPDTQPPTRPTARRADEPGPRPAPRTSGPGTPATGRRTHDMGDTVADRSTPGPQRTAADTPMAGPVAPATRRHPLDPAPPASRHADDTAPAALRPSRSPASRPASAEAPWRPGGDDLERLRRTSRMSDAVLDEVRGRHIRSGDHWLIDFASCNYLGFDFDPEIIAAIEPSVRRWGTHPSWSRLIGSPRLYPDIEERLTALLGAPDTLLLPTATLIHTSVIPVLADRGHVFVEATAHRTVYDGCVFARGHGATLRRFHAERPDELEAQLCSVPSGLPRLVCVDGVNSMSGDVVDLPALAAVCRRRDATLYVDDTHGFGVIGERGPSEPCPYGLRGNSVVRHTGETYEGIVLVGGFSKAYSSLLAFLALPSDLKDRLKTAAAPYLYSGPSPTASLATTMAGLDVNDRRGDAVRADLHRKTARVLDHLAALGVDTLNTDGLPIVEIPLADAGDLEAVAEFLWDEGIYVTLAAYPLVPRDRVGFRVQITALNSDDDIGRLIGTLTRLTERHPLRPRS